METQITDINKKIDIHISEQRQDFDKIHTKLDGLGNKFAGKYVEKGFWIMFGILITSIIAQLL